MVIWYLYFRSFSDTSMVSWIVLLLQREIRRERRWEKGEERKRINELISKCWQV
jgi:hypothetical protein